MNQDEPPPLEVQPKLSVEAGEQGVDRRPGVDLVRTAERAELRVEQRGEQAQHHPAHVPGQRTMKVVGAMRSVRLVVSVVGMLLVGGIFLMKFLASSHGLGDVVLTADECRSGQMLRRSSLLHVTGICTIDCQSDDVCGTKFQCHDGHCVPRGTHALGEDCSAPWECGSFLCLERTPSVAELQVDPGKEGGAGFKPPRSYCSQPCSESTPCPSGYFCGEASGDSACLEGTSPGASLEEMLRQMQGATGRNLPAAEPVP